MRPARPLILAACAALALPSAPALAACVDDVKLIKEEFRNVRDVRKRDLLKREISAADTALKRKSEQACKRAVANAQRIMRSRP